MRKSFYDRLNIIDEVISQGPDACELSRDVEPYLLEDASIIYFFNNLQDSAWLDILIRAGKFHKVPAPIQDAKKGNNVYPLWPESRYLARMAASESNKVLEEILQLPNTEDIRIHEDIADAALAMPANLATKLVPKIITWFESQSQLLLPEKLGKLISHLAQGGQVGEALHLTRSLLAISPDPIMPSEPKARFDDWYYEQILIKHIPDLVKVAHERALTLFCDLLYDAISISLNKKDDEKSDYSFIWRPAIEDHNQNQPHGLKSMLVSAVRDTAESLMDKKGESIFEAVEVRPFKVFQRIGLHLRRKWPQVDAKGTASHVIEFTTFDDLDLHHEYFHLLHEQFTNFSPKIQHAYLALVTKGPNQEEGERYMHHWQYAKLWPIHEFLDTKWRKQFHVLNDKFGDLKHPDFESYIGVEIGDKSPKGVEDLHSMKFDELISFLKIWVAPKDTFMGTSSRGLGQKLTALVASKPESFAVEAWKFQEVKPTYVHALLLGFHEAVKSENNFQWLHVIELCHWITNQPSDDDSDFDWAMTRKTIGMLFSAAFESDTLGIPFALRTKVWEVLSSLTNDSNPTPEHEQQYGGSNMNPAMLSINTTRGSAMHAVVRYALWVRRQIELKSNGKEHIKHGFDEMPEVREILDYHLKPSHDPALAIRAVYGQWLPWLVKLDSQWTAQNLSNIFPKERGFQKLRDAAWATYLTFCAPYDAVFELLQDEYSNAINRIGIFSSEGKNIANPDERLVKHLMTYYWRGKLNLDEPEGLLAQLYARAPDSLCIYALDFVGHTIYKTKESVEPKVLNRLQELWEQRIKTVRDTKPKELMSFGWWFTSAKFDDNWAILQLKNVLELAGEIKADHMVVAHLATLSVEMPLLTIECLALLVESDKDGWHMHVWKEHSRTIFSTVLQSTDDDARQIALNLIDCLGARGNLAFRDLL